MRISRKCYFEFIEKEYEGENMKKKIALMLTSILLCTAILSGCAKRSENTTSVKGEETKKGTEDRLIRIVTTIFPEYDWVKQILGDKAENFELVNLFEEGVDLHSYQPTAEDIAKISESELFIYVGGESDAWAKKVVKEASNKGLVAINLLETLGNEVKDEEMVEGMEHGHSHHHDHDHEKDEAHDHDHEKDEAHHHHIENEKDEHVWLSLRHASTLVRVIAEKIKKLDPENSTLYEANTTHYIKKLMSLDEAFEEKVEKAARKTVLFGDRFPFRYLVDDYDLDYFAAFSGCSAETEASFETVAFLAKKTDELGLSKILIIENSNGKLAETIVGSTKDKNQEIVMLNSMQSVTKTDLEKGLSYLSVMENNLNLIASVLE